MHLAVILDGNRRFAAKNGMSIEEGYRVAAERVEELFEWFVKKKEIKTLSVFALSILNYERRPKRQINALVKIFYSKMKEKMGEMEKRRGEIGISILSLIERRFPLYIRNLIKFVNREFGSGARRVNFLFGYDSETELENALKLSRRNGKPLRENLLVGYDSETELENALKLSRRNGKPLRENLLVKEPVDLLVRTGNEKRLSGFLLYQSSQAQIYFEKRMFPETNRHVWDYWIRWFKSQERRFGR